MLTSDDYLRINSCFLMEMFYIISAVNDRTHTYIQDNEICMMQDATYFLKM